MKPPRLTRRHLLAATAFAGLPLALGSNSVVAAASVLVTAYRDPGCGCCEKWAEAMTAAGFTVSMSDDPQLAERRRSLGVPQGLAGCHVALVEGYVIEGHVPPTDIHRLLAEKPRAMGLAVPGMPLGSPGMESGDGAADPFEVVLFTSTGERKVFASY